jgi:succinyl-diaminopimelate desuccinylase
MQLLRGGVTSDEILAAAQVDYESVVSLTGKLVGISSRGGVDPYEPIISAIEEWFVKHDYGATRLYDGDKKCVGILCNIEGAEPGPRYVLDACVDTAPFGDVDAWSHSPTSGAIVDGWMYGRGTSDSKAAVAIFAHLAVRLQKYREQLHGNVSILFDADEHTGRFGGAKAYFSGSAAQRDVAGVMIGYPGSAYLTIGGRGVMRAEITVRGLSGHSGDNRRRFPNALTKAADLVTMLSGSWLPQAISDAFPLGPQATVTRIEGGEGFSVVPDVCRMNVDVRLTPLCDEELVRALLSELIVGLDSRWPDTPSSSVVDVMCWPPYRLDEDAALVQAVVRAAAEFGITTIPKIAGPANIGNYLASLGIPTLAGFGVTYHDLHGTNERIELASIPSVQATYHRAIISLLS